MTHPIFERSEIFCERFGLTVPILMAPMAGACPTSLAIAVGNAGGMGACGALLMDPQEMTNWAKDVRKSSNGNFQMNLWIPDPVPTRDPEQEARAADFLSQWGPPVTVPDQIAMPDFDAQTEALLTIRPTVVSSIMGLFAPAIVAQLKDNNISWFATVTTVEEARLAVNAGADVVVAQGMEAGGHRGAFNAEDASQKMVGLFSLLPAVVDAVDVPVVATGGIGDARGIAAALTLGASAVQIGTGLLRSPEAKIATPWADALATAQPEDTAGTRAFSGRLGRSLLTDYVAMANSADTPEPAPYPLQRAMTGPMRTQAAKEGDLQRMQVWAGQSARLAQAQPATEIVDTLWRQTCAMFEN